MRNNAIRILTCCLLASCGWLLGRQAGISPSPSNGNGKDPITGIHVSDAEFTGAGVTDSLSSAAFCSAVAEFPVGEMEVASFADFARLTERLPVAELPDALARLGQLNRNWQARLLELWATRNAGAAQAWFEAQAQAERAKLFPQWVDTWARVNPAGLRQWLTSRADDERANLSEGYDCSWVNTLAESDPTATLQLAELYPKLIYPPSILQVWAARDPLAAATAALELSADERSTAAEYIMREWGSDDPEGALAWIEQLSNRALIKHARKGFVLAVSQKDPEAALHIIRSRFPVGLQDRQVSEVATYASMKDPERVAALAQQQSDPQVRRKLAIEAIRFMADKEAGMEEGLWPFIKSEAKINAKRAADLWIAESNIGGEALPHLNQVVAALASQYGVDAMVNFLDRIPPQFNVDTTVFPGLLASVRGWNEVAIAALNMHTGERRAFWLEKAVSGLVKEGDFTPIQSLLDRLPSGSERDGIVRTFAAANFNDDPQSSAALLLDLPNGRVHLENHVAGWLKNDLFETRRWILRTDVFTEEEKRRLLSSSVTPNNGSEQ